MKKNLSGRFKVLLAMILVVTILMLPFEALALGSADNGATPDEPEPMESTELSESTEPTENTEPTDSTEPVENTLPPKLGKADLSATGAALSGGGSQEDPYIIATSDDWDALSASVNSGSTQYSGKYFLLTDDISVTTVLGNRPDSSTDSNDNCFSGTFDGGGHELNVDINESGFGAAPFAIAHNATIKNLHVTGTVSSGANHATGLVAASKGRSIYDASYLTIRNVTVSTDISCPSHIAGIVGHAHSADITMENVVFDGSMSASSVQGGMIGWGGLGNGATYSASFKDCLFAGTYNTNAAFYPVAFANGQGTVTLVNDFYSTKTWSGGSPIPTTGDGQLKLLAATVEKDGSVRYFDSINTAADSSNWVAGSALRLMTDVTTSSTITVPSGEHTLDLNGHGIRMTGWGSVFYVGDGAKMIINDSDTDATHRFEVPDGAGLASLNEASGTYTVSGGYITGGNADNGGGIYIAEYGEAVMNGGALIGNHAEDNGAGIRMESNTSFTLNGGEIAYNQASVHGGGLGLAYTNHTTITINDGAIHHNICECAGGAVTLDNDPDSYLYLYGGVISDNASVSGSGNNPWHPGGIAGNANIHVKGAPQVCNNINLSSSNIGASNHNIEINTSENDFITLDGPLSEGARIAVSYHTSGSKTTGVFTSGWNTYMGNAEPAEYFVSDYDEYIVSLSGGEAAVSLPPVASIISGETATNYGSLSDAISAWTAGSTLKLLTDVTATAAITVPAGAHTLDLNGYGVLMKGSDRVITINQGASLELNDSDPDRIHYITLTNYRGTAVSDSGEESVSNGNGVIKVTGGYLTGGYRNNSGSHDRCGAGVYNWGTFVMNGGSIVGNTLYNNSGGAIRNSGYFTMNGGTIAFNYASGNGGGVTTYVPGGSQGKMTMNGGEISDNYCGSYGGGIQIAGPIEMTGGSVVRNTAGAGGSGVFYDGKNDRFKLSGNPVIKDNSNNDDLYLGANATFMINGSLTEEADIHVLMNTPAAFTVGWKNIMGNADPSKNFTSANSGYAVILNNNGEAEIAPPPVASIISGDVTTNYSTISDAVNAWTAGSTLKLLADVTTNSTITIPSGEHTLDLNGHGIKMTGNASAFTVSSGAKLIINDSNADTEHKFTLTNAQLNEAGLATVNDSLTSGYKTFNGGYITGGKGNSRSSWREGGAIYIEGEVEMYAGTLIGNGIHGTTHGGGFVTRENGRFVMHGGSIQNNAGLCGGACRLVGGSAEIDGGTIINNIVTNDGGAIHVGGTIPLVLKDCEISGNYAGGGPGAGIWMSNDGTTVSGKTLIKDNYVGSRQDNIEIPSGRVLYIGELTDGTSIGITMQSDTGVFTSGWKDKMGDADPSKYFTSDNDDYIVDLDDSGEACLRYPDVPDVSAEGYEGGYDGAAHGITVSIPDGAEVKYGTQEGSYTLTDNPTYTDAGTYTIYYEASMEKYTSVYGSAVVQIDPIDVTVTVTGHNDTADYDGKAHSIEGYDAAASSDLYDVTKDFTFSGTAKAERTDAGTTAMGLTASQFANTNDNFATVTFNVTDGYITIDPIDVTVTVTGHNDTADYDGKAHAVTGYDVEFSSTLYAEEYFTFSGTAKAERTDAGTTAMGLSAEQFSNTNDNFATVTFNVTDGYITIDPIDVTVTVTGHNSSVDYDGKAHTVSGYDVEFSTPLYTEADFTFSGEAKAERTVAGTSVMGLSADQFANTNDNFANVTFDVTDGTISICTINVTVTVIGHSTTADYDGELHSISGYDAYATSDLYDVTKDFTFSGTAEAERTDAGTTEMGLSADQFANTNTNFSGVTFIVTDGYVTIDPIDVTVTVTGHNDTADYDGKAHSIEGYDAAASSDLYDVTKDFSFSGKAKAERTDAGTTDMGLAADQFSNTNSNFATVTFDVTDGYMTVDPIDITVTVTGHNSTASYDGKAHSIEGYDAVASSDLYDVTKDFTFSGKAKAERTDAGTTDMGLAADQFSNTNSNFATVTFDVTDGYMTVDPIDVTVTVTGHNGTAKYDGKAHSIEGYDAAASSDLYDVTKDFSFSGKAKAERTDAGTTAMGLTASQFANTNDNFATVTFNVTDGCITVDPIDVTVTVTGHNSTVDYDGKAHSVTGYDAEFSTPLYTEADFTFSGTAKAERTDAGTAKMGLTASQFANTNNNFAAVTFNITDGYITVAPIDVTVTIVGSSTTADYDGDTHIAYEYAATADTELYSVEKDFTFISTAYAERVDAGVTYMGMKPEHFENTNDNFADVTFVVTDGYVRIDPISTTVTITGSTGTAVYDGTAHIVSGYDASADSDLYDVTKDFAFTGTAQAEQTDAGTAYMGLAPEQFSNISPNFTDVAFIVTDGYQTVTRADAVITTAPYAKSRLVYTGASQQLVMPGSVIGGTLYYALGADGSTAPAASRYSTKIPTASQVGNYYIWYKVIADTNHNSIAPAYLKITLAEPEWMTIRGTITFGDGSAASGDVTVTLMSGSTVVDTIVTDASGGYYFTVPAGVYNLVITSGDVTQTVMVDITEGTVRDITLSDANTMSILDVISSEISIVVGGLDDEAAAIRSSEGLSPDQCVTVRMTVETVSADDTTGSAAISDYAEDRYLEFYDMRVERTIDSVTTALSETQNILEVVIPFSYTSKRDLAVYRYDGSGVQELTESDTRAADTYRVDYEAGLVYIYTNRFTIFAISYKPYYRVNSLLTLGGFSGSVSVKLTKDSTGDTYELNNVSIQDISFTGVPKGTYTMTVTWKDGAENTLTLPFVIQ